MSKTPAYLPIEDYALLSDCFSAALVSRSGSIDWLCLPRLDSGSYFARLLDHEHGGFCSLAPTEPPRSLSRRYVEDSLVLETTFETETGTARVTDCLVVREGGREEPPHQLLRIVDGVSGRVDFGFHCAPVFDYGEVRPWIRPAGAAGFSAIGGDDGLVIAADTELVRAGHHAVRAGFSVGSGERTRFALTFTAPEELDYGEPATLSPEEYDDRLEETLQRWAKWAARATEVKEPAVLRSALVLRGLVHVPTGAIAAAPTTSLPEVPGGAMNWDYRYCWVRDAFFSVRALAEIGLTGEADGFRRFVQRTCAGHADEMKPLFGLGGERRLVELEVGLAGYDGASPVRIGNAAAGQLQLDAYGEVLELTWLWHQRGHSPDDDFWRFLLDLVETAAARWREPDHGFWEGRGKGEHFTQSKMMCWLVLDRGIRLAQDTGREAPTDRWQRTRDEIREAVETRGYDAQRGVFVQAFDNTRVDAALLLLPKCGFIDYTDERMVATVDAIREDLDDDGLLKRFPGSEAEGAFLACTFWLAECLCEQGRTDAAREAYERALATSNDLGLFAEQYDTDNTTMLGNFPQGLSHLAHIAAARTLAGRDVL